MLHIVHPELFPRLTFLTDIDNFTVIVMKYKKGICLTSVQLCLRVEFTEDVKTSLKKVYLNKNYKLSEAQE